MPSSSSNFVSLESQSPRFLSFVSSSSSSPELSASVTRPPYVSYLITELPSLPAWVPLPHPCPLLLVLPNVTSLKMWMLSEFHSGIAIADSVSIRIESTKAKPHLLASKWATLTSEKHCRPSQRHRIHDILISIDNLCRRCMTSGPTVFESSVGKQLEGCLIDYCHLKSRGETFWCFYPPRQSRSRHTPEYSCQLRFRPRLNT